MNIQKNMEIGRRIKAISEDMGIFQTKLGDWIGVSYQQIQKYENGRSSLSVDKLERIAAALKMPVNYFFGDYKKKGKEWVQIKEGDKKYSTGTIETDVLTVDEKILLRRYRSIKNKDARRGLLLLVKGLFKYEL